MIKVFSATAAAILSSAIPATSAEYLVTHPKEPLPAIFDQGGLVGENSWAKAKVERAQAEDYCENFQPGEPLSECADMVMGAEQGRVYEASANCHSGELVSVDGRRYVYDGLWDNGGFWHGTSRFKDAESGKVVADNNAEGGPVLTANWNQLCPYGAPLDRQPLKMVLGDSPDDYGLTSEPMVLDGSLMNVDHQKGTITFTQLAPAMEGLVEQNALAFRGVILPEGHVSGMAFSYAKGCDPVPYRMDGHYQQGELHLDGAAPVREGCAVSGYSEDAPGAKLRLKPAWNMD